MSTAGDGVWRAKPSYRFADRLEPRTIIPAVWDVLSAAAAKSAGATHLFLSGAAINNVHGYPDRGLLDISAIADCVREITNATDLPMLVDAETGFGPAPRLCRLVDELARAGVTAILIEDQDETGQTKTQTVEPALCKPEVMCERLDLIRSTVGDEVSILARTDYLPNMDFEESLDRLRMYDQAGADWLIPVFAPSLDALAEAASTFRDRLFVLAASPPINGAMRYCPTYDELELLLPRGVLVTGQYRNVFASLQGTYRKSLAGEWEEVFRGRPEPVGFDKDLGLTRHGMTL